MYQTAGKREVDSSVEDCRIFTSAAVYRGIGLPGQHRDDSGSHAAYVQVQKRLQFAKKRGHLFKVFGRGGLSAEASYPVFEATGRGHEGEGTSQSTAKWAPQPCQKARTALNTAQTVQTRLAIL